MTKTVLVWVLVAYFSWGNREGGPAVVTDLATREECERLAARLNAEMSQFRFYTCTQVRKAVP
jgi:hypothetical protein